MNIQEKYCETSYGKICYLEAGNEDKIFLIIHGGFGTPGVADGLLETLLSKNYRVIAPYLPGHGGSYSLPKIFSFADFLESINEFIASLKSKDISLLGHSFGGGIALGLAIKNPGKFKKIILADPLLNAKKLSLLSITVGIIIDVLKDGAFYSALKPQFRNFLPRQPHFSEVLQIWNIAKNINVLDFGSMVEGKINILWGKNDLVVPFKTQLEVLDKIGKYEIKFVDGGHYWYVRNQKLFLSSINKIIG